MHGNKHLKFRAKLDLLNFKLNLAKLMSGNCCEHRYLGHGVELNFHQRS
jgi:hypothetical protein